MVTVIENWNEAFYQKDISPFVFAETVR